MVLVRNRARLGPRQVDMCNSSQYDRLREKWVHEDEVINHRLTWLLVSQTILFAGYGALLRMPEKAMHAEKINDLIVAVPRFGIVTSVLILVSILAATATMYHLKGKNACVEAYGTVTIFGLAASLGLPVVFVLAWVVALRL